MSPTRKKWKIKQLKTWQGSWRKWVLLEISHHLWKDSDRLKTIKMWISQSQSCWKLTSLSLSTHSQEVSKWRTWIHSCIAHPNSTTKTWMLLLLTVPSIISMTPAWTLKPTHLNKRTTAWTSHLGSQLRRSMRRTRANRFRWILWHRIACIRGSRLMF